MTDPIAPNRQENGYSRAWSLPVSLLLAILVFLVDVFVPLGVTITMLYVIVIFISFWSPRQATTRLAILTSVLAIVGYHFSPPGGEWWKNLLNRALSTILIWATAYLTIRISQVEAARHQANQEREKALEEVKILRGVLPICASCKKIRDDQGYWNQIEGYIRAHSEAEFSHGICPACAEKLYPELYKTKKPEK